MKVLLMLFLQKRDTSVQEMQIMYQSSALMIEPNLLIAAWKNVPRANKEEINGLLHAVVNLMMGTGRCAEFMNLWQCVKQAHTTQPNCSTFQTWEIRASSSAMAIPAVLVKVI